jgi:hypothetical protein
MDALSRTLQNALDKGEIEGVHLTPINKQALHVFCADDVTLVLKDEGECLGNIIQLFDKFGVTSGLKVDLGETKSSYLLLSSTLPIRLEQLSWSWESNDTATKLLGFPIATSI